MSIPVITFFNNKGGVGKTSLVYHVSWMFAELGVSVLAVDLDPQANLTAAFLPDDQLEELWPDGPHRHTIAGVLDPLQKGTGDIDAHKMSTHDISDASWVRGNLSLIAGDLQLSNFEDNLSEVWPKCLGGDERAFRVTSAFWRIMQAGAERDGRDLILVDVGPNLGAINRAALISSDYVVVPLSPDLFSLQGLRNLGPRLRDWRSGWKKRLSENPEPSLELPAGEMRPIGYCIQQHSVRLDRPVQAYEKWIRQIPGVYRRSVLGIEDSDSGLTVDSDPNCVAMVKHYRSLMPMAQQARKPMFSLKPADGALGAHFQAAQQAHKAFAGIAQAIGLKAGIKVPAPTLFEL
ncbi:MAG TPA: AAA family ATPase [Candidatus Saccharimonadales bacterium]|jgi:chromosome partitioning protein|nr:AAA family ATPase [Candidatus Saccharimonadales bacterium]